MQTPRSKDKGGIFCSCFGNSNKKVPKARNDSILEHSEVKSVTVDKKDDQKKALVLDKPDLNIGKPQGNPEIDSEMVNDHVFPGCHIMQSQHDGAKFNWVDTQQIGWLKIVQILNPSLKDELVTSPPIAHLKLQNVNGECMFEYELPIDFQYQPSLNAHLTAVGTIAGAWTGFQFENEMHHAEFAQILTKFHKASERIQYEECILDLEIAISPEDLFGQDPLKQAEALHKMLLIAGFDEEVDYHDDELMSILSQIVANFDVNAPIDEEAAIFNLRLLAHQGKLMKKQADKIHRNAIKSNQSRKSQYEKKKLSPQAQKESEYIKKGQERQKGIEATEEMKRQMETIKLEKHIELKRLSSVHKDGEAQPSKYQQEMHRIILEKLQRQCPQCSKTTVTGQYCQLCAFKLQTKDKHTENIQIVKSEENQQQNISVNKETVLANTTPSLAPGQKGLPKAPPAPNSSQRGPPKAPSAPAIGQRGPPNAPSAPNSSQRGPPNAPSAPNSSQRGPPNAPSAPNSSQRGPPNAPSVPNSSQRGPPNAPSAPAIGQRGPPSAPQAQKGQKGPPVVSSYRGPTPRPSTGPLIAKSDLKTSSSEHPSAPSAEQLQQQSLKLKSESKKETTSELYSRTDTIIGKISEQLKRQETSIHQKMATTLVSSQSVEVARDKGNFQFFLSIKEAQMAKAQGCGLSFEQQIAMTSKLLKPVDKGPMKVSQKVLDEQERYMKEITKEMSKESLNQKMAQLTAQVHIAINKNKEKRKRRRNSSSQDEDDDYSDVD